MLEYKGSVEDELSKIRAEHLKSLAKVDETSAKLTACTEDTKFWLDKYTLSHRECERVMETIRTDLVSK
jgi:hypothetical protein